MAGPGPSSPDAPRRSRCAPPRSAAGGSAVPAFHRTGRLRKLARSSRHSLLLKLSLDGTYPLFGVPAAIPGLGQSVVLVRLLEQVADGSRDGIGIRDGHLVNPQIPHAPVDQPNPLQVSPLRLGQE